LAGRKRRRWRRRKRKKREMTHPVSFLFDFFDPHIASL
jgi:hypothetical protein